jgi:hypothetical protein
MNFGYKSDRPDIKGFIDRENILEMFDEEDIFSLVFGFRPRLYEYVRSPFRSDSSPGCFFTISPSGRLRFVDFANKDVVYGIKMSNMDCFDAVQTFFKLPNFYLALRFIERNLTKGGKRRKVLKRGPRPVKEKVEMLFQGRNFVRKDAEFWSPYGISRVNLLEDNVFPVSRILMRNTRNGDVDTLLKETCYAYTGFEERIKFYFPYRKGTLIGCPPMEDSSSIPSPIRTEGYWSTPADIPCGTRTRAWNPPMMCSSRW